MEWIAEPETQEHRKISLSIEKADYGQHNSRFESHPITQI